MDWLRQKLESLQHVEGYVVPAGNGAPTDMLEALAPLKLDANENHFIEREWLAQLTKEAAEEIDPRIYSVTELGELKHAIAEDLEVAPERIVLGCGADQLIDFIASTFLRPGAIAACLTPTYSFYRIRTLLHGSRMIEIPLEEDFGFPLTRAIEEAREARVCFLCSPNNPTGNQFNRDEVIEFAKHFAGLVVVDEAYADFAAYRLVRDVADERNLIVLRTFSKSHGLAGLRIGYIVAPSALAEVFIEKIQYPYPLSQGLARIATKVVRSPEVIHAAVEAMRNERARLLEEIAGIGKMQVFPSEGNFVLFRFVGDAKALHQRLNDLGIHIKYMGAIRGRSGYLRTTVGTRSMNDRLIAAMKKAVGSRQ